MGKERIYLHCSSSISNFEEKLLRRTGLEEYNPINNIFDKVIFFGLYHELDYLRFSSHQGEKKVFWCGSDILNLQKKNPIVKNVIKAIKAQHYVENDIERSVLRSIGIKSMVRPMLFDDQSIPISFESTKFPHVYTTTHIDSHHIYGINKIEQMAEFFPKVTFHIYGKSKPFNEVGYDDRMGIKGDIHNLEYAHSKNVVYHGVVSNEQFLKEIRGYQGALRLNKFDGFSEILAKSILMGQYPISMISYKHITHVYNGQTLRRALEQLSNKKKPNKEGRVYWNRALQENLYAVIS